MTAAESDPRAWKDEGRKPGARNVEGSPCDARKSSGEEDGYTVYSASDALLPQPPIKWVVEGLLPEDSVNLIVGRPGCKKTWLVLDMAACIAAGVPWLGRTTEQCPVLFVDEETGERWMKERVKMVLKGRNLEQELPYWFISDGLFNLNTQAGVDRLKKAVIKRKARLVCIDAMVDIMAGSDENRASDGVQPMLQGLRRIANETHCVIVAIHHTKKDDGRKFRGTNAIEAAVNNIILVQSNKNESLVTLSCERAKNSAHFPEFAAYANITSESFTMEPTAVPVRTGSGRIATLGKAQKYVLKYLKEHGPSRAKDIIGNAAGCTRSAAKDALYKMAQTGTYIHCKDHDVDDPDAGYTLTDSGDAVV